MTRFNMNQTWSQAVALVRANFQLLAIIAGVFLLLPSLLFVIFMPDTINWMRLSQDPEAIAAAMGGAIIPLALFGLASFVLQLTGYGAMIALVSDGRPTVGEAIARGGRGLPTMIGATLLFILAYLVVLLLASTVIGLLTAALTGIGAGALSAVVAIALFAALFMGVLYTAMRLSLTLAVVMIEGVRSPIVALRRSWALTAPYAWPILGFYVLLAITYFVISLLVFGLLGLIAALLGEGMAATAFMGLVNGLLGALVAMVMSGIFAAMYQQLAGRGIEALGRTFE